MPRTFKYFGRTLEDDRQRQEKKRQQELERDEIVSYDGEDEEEEG